MSRNIPITFFASAKREPVKVVHRQARRLGRSPLTRPLLNGSLNYVFLLNSRRQIVMASENVLELVPGKTMDDIVGLRPGEALGCIHAFDCGSGCGTSQFCRKCGVVRVILSGLGGRRQTRECRLRCMVGGQEAFLKLRLLATPLMQDHERYTLLAVETIHNRRR